MIRIHLSNIEKSERESFKSCAERIVGSLLYIDETSPCYKKIIADRIAKRAANPDQPTENETAIPRDKWPFAAKAVASLAIPSDKGVGDVVERLATDSGIKTLVKMLPFDCGCPRRRERWNLIFPLR